MKKKLFLFSLVLALGYYFIRSYSVNEEENYAITTEEVEPDSGKTQLLKEIVKELSEVSPPRNYSHIASLNKCADYIKTKFESYGLNTKYQSYKVDNNEYKNVSAFLGDMSRPRIIVGAHYDVAGEFPGADDNASGVAVMIEVAKRLSKESLKNISVEFVAYTLEEPPYFRTENMGSNIHAQSVIDENVKVWGLVNLEMVGFYTDETDSQDYPVPGMGLIYPNKGNFIAVVGNSDNSEMVELVSGSIKRNSKIRTISLAAPSALPGIDFSDHLNYWSRGMPAIMLTDTAFYRNKAYHTENDTMDRLNFSKMQELAEAVAKGIIEFDSSDEE